MRLLPIITVLLATSVVNAGDYNPIVMRYALVKSGSVVGEGECGELPIAALAFAGARQVTEVDGIASWGQLVRKVTPGDNGVGDAEPGDILFMQNVTVRTGDGVMTTVQHSAIVSSVSNGGRTVEVMHQWRGQPVCHGTYHLDDVRAGWVKVFRPER